ncbi:MAG TPA: ABC transporter substrate-binding protein [Acidimicrobiales bacterium]|nr:ABC transporter substrate-binding protein [Acidimicrobiales bacterium]
MNGRETHRSTLRTRIGTAGAAAAAALTSVTVVAGLLGGVSSASSVPPAARSAPHKIGGSVSVWGEWTSTEQTAFEAALKPFEKSTGITVNYSGKGSNMDTALEAAVSGGKPPAVAFVPDPGTLRVLAGQGKVQNLGPVIGSLKNNYGDAWNELASVNGKLYGVWFKAANKNTVWYNPALFKEAGISSTPTTWQGMLADAAELRAAGVTPFSLCTDIGWPVADLWQNVYLKTAGARNYNLLATGKIPWTDSTVTRAFNVLRGLVGTPSFLFGGTQGSLANKYPDCVDKVFPKAGTMPQAAMVIEADFVTSEITGNSPNYNAGTKGKGGAACTANPAQTPCYDFFPFPAPKGFSVNSGALQGAGDVGMMLTATRQAKALMKYIATAQPGEIWAHLGGFTSPNKKVPLSAYPDAVTRADAQELTTATSFVFSLDDLQGTWEPQMWQDMLNFVKTPTAANVTSIEKTMQSQATAARAKSGK